MIPRLCTAASTSAQILPRAVDRCADENNRSWHDTSTVRQYHISACHRNVAETRMLAINVSIPTLARLVTHWVKEREITSDVSFLHLLPWYYVVCCYTTLRVLTRSQAVARIADRTAKIVWVTCPRPLSGKIICAPARHYPYKAAYQI